MTIDRFATSSSASHAADGALSLIGRAYTYQLSDASQWMSGSGYSVGYQARLDHVEVVGSTVRYFLLPPISTRLYQQTDYDSGEHSSQGTLGAVGPLVLEAENGATDAVLHGQLAVLENDVTSYGEPRFNYFTAVVGAVVPFDTTITIQGDTWTPDVFGRAFDYWVHATVDFQNPISTPRPIGLSISGPSRIPGQSAIAFSADVLFEGGSIRNRTITSTWAVSPTDAAAVTNGVVTTGVLGVPEETLTLQASFVQGVDEVSGQKLVRLLAVDPAESADSWPMFQANAGHTGFVASDVDPRQFVLKWQRPATDGFAPMPVVAGEGKVLLALNSYYSNVDDQLLALGASDGSAVWSKDLGPQSALSAPAFAYGEVFLGTSGPGGSALRAFDADTGGDLFTTQRDSADTSLVGATVFDGKLYVSDPNDGGVMACDAYDGSRLWTAPAPYFYQWLPPAVDNERVWEYEHTYSPGVYGQLRATGDIDLFVADPVAGCCFNGSSLAPVLGNAHDLIVIEGGRLVSFDLLAGKIRWTIASSFSGQPSVAGGFVYAIDAGGLRVFDELTHAEVWSWSASEGALTSSIILTPSYLLVSSFGRVHALSLSTKGEVWSYPTGGRLALADGNLYVLADNGMLTALAAPTALGFYSLAPCRIYDTRLASGPSAGAPTLLADDLRTLPVVGK